MMQQRQLNLNNIIFFWSLIQKPLFNFDWLVLVLNENLFSLSMCFYVINFYMKN